MMTLRDTRKAESIARSSFFAIDALQSADSYDVRAMALQLAVGKLRATGYTFSADTISKLKDTL